MDFLRFWKTARTRSSRRTQLSLEQLESRLVPYSLSGDVWPHPNLITLSFVPDGTDLGGVKSNLFATFNAKFGSATAWQNQILKAAQTWAQQTNVNFALVSDNGAALGSGSYQQGDPAMGDIRIAGYNFGNSNLAQAYMPAADNNYSIAGDVQFNTGQTFNINQTYDLYTVAVHEIGHALGLDHSGTYTADMYAVYSSAKTAATSDDIAGIQSLYSKNGPRSADQYAGANSSFQSAVNLTPLVNGSTLTAVVPNLDITQAGEKDYYQVTVPAGTSGTFQVTLQSQGFSLLAPTLTVYNSAQSQVGFASGSGKYGTTLTVKVTGVSAGQVYYIKAAGADSSAFGTGAYALTLNFGSGASPSVPLPNTQTTNGTPLSGGGGQAYSTTSEFQVNTTGISSQPPSPSGRSVAMTGNGNYVSVWASYSQSDGWGVYGQRYDHNGARQGDEFWVNSTEDGAQSDASVASDSAGNFVAAWASYSHGRWVIRAQRFNSSGNMVGNEFQVSTATTGDQLYPNVAINDSDNFVITWSGQGADGHWDVYAQKYSWSAGLLGGSTAQGGNFRVNSATGGDQMYSSVALGALGNFTIVWQSNAGGSGWDIYGQNYTVLGLPLLGNFRVNSTTAGDQEFPSIAMNPLDTACVVTWSSNGQDGSGWGVYGQAYTALGLPLGGEFQVNTTTAGDQSHSSVTVAGDGSYFITWTSGALGATSGMIYGQQYTALGIPLGKEMAISSTSGGKNYATVAIGPNNAVVVWSGSGSGGSQGVFGRLFQLSGFGVNSLSIKDAFSPTGDEDGAAGSAAPVLPQQGVTFAALAVPAFETAQQLATPLSSSGIVSVQPIRFAGLASLTQGSGALPTPVVVVPRPAVAAVSLVRDSTCTGEPAVLFESDPDGPTTPGAPPLEERSAEQADATASIPDQLFSRDYTDQAWSAEPGDQFFIESGKAYGLSDSELGVPVAFDDTDDRTFDAGNPLGTVALGLLLGAFGDPRSEKDEKDRTKRRGTVPAESEEESPLTLS